MAGDSLNVPTAYVYAILVDGVIRYVGKGDGLPMKRAREHMRRVREILRNRESGSRKWASSLYNKLAKAATAGLPIEERPLYVGLTEHEAYRIEIEQIDALGAQLWNQQGGGRGGWKPTAETRQKLSEAAKRRAATVEGKEHLVRASKASRISPRQRKRCMTPEMKVTLSAMKKADWNDEARAERMRAGLAKGRKSPRVDVGKKRWAKAEWRVQHSESMRKKWADPVYRERMRLNRELRRQK